jgi:hypothetical protein
VFRCDVHVAGSSQESGWLLFPAAPPRLLAIQRIPNNGIGGICTTGMGNIKQKIRQLGCFLDFALGKMP